MVQDSGHFIRVTCTNGKVETCTPSRLLSGYLYHRELRKYLLIIEPYSYSSLPTNVSNANKVLLAPTLYPY